MKFIKSSLFVALMMGSTVAVADTSELTFELEANVPTDSYYVRYNDKSFGENKQTLPWDHVNEKLSGITTILEAKNSKGPITAHLINDAELVHADDEANNIALDVKIANQTLPTGPGAPVEILNAAQGGSQNNLSLDVAPATGASFAAGDYEGTVTMVFDYGV